MNDAPAILALHGNLGLPADWEALDLPGLRAVDLWAHVRLGFDEFADELAGPLSAGLGRPLLAGYSLGGRLALHALARHPERWGGAVIVAAHPGLASDEDRRTRTVSDALWADRARRLPWEEFLEQWNAWGHFAADPPTRRERLLALEARREDVARAFETWSLGRQEDLRPALAAFARPVLWITGERDERFTRLGSEMVAVFRDFRHLVVPGGGHRLLASSPEAVAGTIRDFALGLA